MGISLAEPQDVADLWRPLTSDETQRVENLIGKASALLRQRLPWVDARMARFAVDATDEGGLDPLAVANVVAGIVKRFLVNPDGATNMSEASGPYSQSKGFALRGDKDVRGELIVTDSDVEALTPPKRTRARAGTIVVSPRLAPSRFGDIPYDALGAGGVTDPGSAPLDTEGWISP